MAQVARCAWCNIHKGELGRMLVVSQSDDNKAWLGHVCITCYADLGVESYLRHRSPNTEGMAVISFDALPDSLKADVAILRLAPPYKHVQGVGIRVGDYYEVVLTEP